MRRSFVPLLLVAGGLAVAATGCGSSDDDHATAGQPLAGKTIGYSTPTAANLTLSAIGDGLAAEVEGAGGEVKMLDSQGRPEKQLTDIKQFIAQGVDALVVHPLAWESVRGVLRQAERKGIPVVVHDAVFEDPTAERLAPARFQVLEGREAQAAEAVSLLEKADKLTGGTVAMTFCPNPPTHQYLMAQFGDALKGASGAKLLDTVCNPTDDSSGAFTVAQRALTRFPKARSVFAYNDSSAIGTAKAAAKNGTRKQLFITGYNAEPQGVEAVAKGEIDATWDYKPVEVGQALGDGVKQILSGDDGDLPVSLTIEPELVVADNVDRFVPWKDRVEQVRQGKTDGTPATR